MWAPIGRLPHLLLCTFKADSVHNPSPLRRVRHAGSLGRARGLGLYPQDSGEPIEGLWQGDDLTDEEFKRVILAVPCGMEERHKNGRGETQRLDRVGGSVTGLEPGGSRGDGRDLVLVWP